jgi:hypothetical protein
MVTPKGKFEDPQATIFAEFYILLEYITKNKPICLALVLLPSRRLTMAASCLCFAANIYSNSD